jgi:hypothetical protein
MSNREPGSVRKVKTAFGPVHICASPTTVRYAHNDRLTDSAVGHLLEQLGDATSELLSELEAERAAREARNG